MDTELPTGREDAPARGPARRRVGVEDGGAPGAQDLAGTTFDAYQAGAAVFDAARSRSLAERGWLERLAAAMPPRAPVLDLGCGAGEPIAAWLIGRGHPVTGLDFAPAMLAIARARWPAGDWRRGDMRALDLPERFGGVVAWDSFFHLTAEEQRGTLPRMARHVAPGGALLTTVGPRAGAVAGRVAGLRVHHASLDVSEYAAIPGGFGDARGGLRRRGPRLRPPLGAARAAPVVRRARPRRPAPTRGVPMTIRTTHTGSLPRPQAVVDQLFARERGEPTEGFDQTMRAAVHETVRRQVEAGVDVVSDGETSKISYATYVKDRYTGFEGDGPRNAPADLKMFPSFLERLAREGGTPTYARPMCVGEVRSKGQDELRADIVRLRAAMEAHGAAEGFMNAASPGVVSLFLQNEFYPSRDAYLAALADAMAEEYRTIVDAGLILQLDCPDLALSRHMLFADLTDEEFVRVAETHVEALAAALSGIDPGRVRVHICWGNYEGPHVCDIAMDAVFSTFMSVPARAPAVRDVEPAPRPRVDRVPRSGPRRSPTTRC